MARRSGNLHFGLLLLALGIAVFLWGVAHGSSSIERAFDVPVELHGLDDTLVVTDQSADSINVRVMGSRAALRNVEPTDLLYPIDISGGQEGVAEYEVDVSRLELPRGARPIARSPSRVEVRFERRGRKAVSVRVDVEGEPAEGYYLEDVRPVPGRIWLAGARSQVLSMKEVVTEPVDLTGLTESQEKEVRLFLGSGTVWVEEDKPVKVQIRIAADPVPEPEAEGAETAQGAAGGAQGEGPSS